MKSFTHIVLIAVLISGCQSNPNRVPDLHYGMTYNEVDDAIWGDDVHEFRALLTDDVFSCYTVEFGRRAGARYFFSFKNDQLVSIVRSAPFFEWETTVTTAGSKKEAQAAWEDEDRVNSILSAEPLKMEDFRNDVATRLEIQSQKKDLDLNVLPAFIVLSPLLVPYAVSYNREEKKFAKRFNPELIDIGMSRKECNDVYGPPVFIVEHEEHLTHVYGPTEKLDIGNGRVSLNAGSKYRYWTAVRFERGAAVRIYSNRLFNEKALIKTEFMVDRPEINESSIANNTGTYGLYYCAVHNVAFDNPANPHMEHSSAESSPAIP